MSRDHTGLFAFLCVGIFAYAPGTAQAGLIPSGDYIVQIDAENAETGEALPSFAQSFSIEEDGSFAASGQTETNDYYVLDDFAVSGNVDPVANLTYGVTNKSAFPMKYEFVMTVPITPQGPSTLIGGSTGGSITDADASGGVTVTDDAGTPFFQGRIDGLTVLSLLTAPFSISAPAGTALIPPTISGLPGPTLPGPAGFFEIEIRNTFILSPGDSLSATNVFQVERIPEPTSAMLSLTGIAAVLGVFPRRHRRADA